MTAKQVEACFAQSAKSIPVMPSFAVSPVPFFLIQATVASRSAITWASGTFETTLEMIS